MGAENAVSLHGTIRVVDSKTAAGVRTVLLTPAVRDELNLWLDRSPFKLPTDSVFPTRSRRKDNRHNIRQRLLHPAVKPANERLVKLGIESLPPISPHALRRSYQSLRLAAGDDPVFVAEQMRHTDPGFSMQSTPKR